LAAGEQAQINFGNVPLALIRAWKFHDLDLDGEKDTDEPMLDGWTMNIDPAVNGIGSGVTAGGYVNFVDLPVAAGTQTLRFDIPQSALGRTIF
jgi:hypothetical protein